MNPENRPAHILATVLAPILILALGTAAVADKIKIEGKPIIKGGPIKSTSGDEAGTLKEVVKMRMMPPPPGTPPQPPINMAFDITIPSADGRSKPQMFRLTGAGTNWQVRTTRNGFGLWIDGRCVDSVSSLAFRGRRGVEIAILSQLLEAKMFPGGVIDIEATDGQGKTMVVFPDVCGPTTKPPVPYPIIKK